MLKIDYLSLCILFVVISGCEKSELNELKQSIGELEQQLTGADSIIYFSTGPEINSDLRITNQSTLDLFLDKNIKRINGTLRIENCSDLTPLTRIEEVTELTIDASGLNSFLGLETINVVKYLNLINLGNGMSFENLAHFQGVRNVFISGDLPERLPFIEDWNSLKVIDIHSSNTSFNLGGLSSLEYINTLKIEMKVPESYVEISGLNNLAEAERIEIRASHIDAQGLSSINYVTQLNLGNDWEYAEYWGDLTGFSRLKEAERISYRGISANGFLDNLESVKSLSINNDASMESFEGRFSTGFSGLEFLELYKMPNIGNLDGINLSSLNHIYLISCPLLTDIKAIRHLKDFHLIDLPIKELPVFISDKFEFIEINSCYNLESIDGLINAQEVWDILILKDTRIQSLKGLNNLTSIRDFTVENNEFLTDWCAVKEIYSDEWYITNNGFNPTSSSDIQNCD